MAEMTRLGEAAALVFGALLVGFLAGPGTGTGSSTAPTETTVSGLYQEMPLDDPVVVTANVTRVLDDHVSDSGNTYQQFMVGDGERTVKVFCGTGSGRTDVAKGDRVQISGTFQEWYGTYEIYTRCTSVTPLA